jgi:hypothetical protein
VPFTFPDQSCGCTTASLCLAEGEKRTNSVAPCQEVWILFRYWNTFDKVIDMATPASGSFIDTRYDGRGRPFVDVEIEWTEADKAALGSGQVVPKAIRGKALVDTGATDTEIKERVCGLLALQALSGVTNNRTTASGESLGHRVYAIKIRLPQISLEIERLEVSCFPEETLRGDGNVAIVGCDILKHCLLRYDGPTGRFSLESRKT